MWREQTACILQTNGWRVLLSVDDRADGGLFLFRFAAISVIQPLYTHDHYYISRG